MTVVHRNGFLKKLRFWRRRQSVAITTPDIATMTDNLPLETGIQVSSLKMILRCDAGTKVHSNLTCEASTQTPNDNKPPEKRTDSGAAENEKGEMKSKRREWLN